MLLSPTTSPGLILLFSFFIGWQIGKKKKIGFTYRIGNRR